MRRLLRVLLVSGLLVGGLTFWATSAEAQPWRRGYGPYGGYGRVRVARPWGYGAYRPVGYGWGRPYGYYGGFGLGYSPAYGYGPGVYPRYSVLGYPAYGYGLGAYPVASGWGYPGYYGTSVSIGTVPFGGVMVRSYPW